MQKPLAAAALLLAGIAAMASAQNLGGNVTLGYEPVWSESPILEDVALIRVRLENTGDATTGTVTIADSMGGQSPEARVELPKGAVKEVVLYGRADFGATIRWQAPFSLIQLPVEGNMFGVLQAGLIGDTPGVLNLLRDQPGAEAPGQPGSQPSGLTTFWRDTYVSPENAPDRVAGYSGLEALFLGEGAERLEDSQVNTIIHYVLQGGTLVIPTGPTPGVTVDPRWRSLLPVRNLRTRAIGPFEYAGQSFPGATVQVGTPVEGSTPVLAGTVPLAVQHSVGLGRVIFLAFDPFLAPFSEWEGRSIWMAQLLDPGNSTPAASWRQAMAGSEESYRGGPFAPAPQSGDPFTAQLPSPFLLFVILAAYFVLVVPINFFVLKKLNKGEMAWVTAPALALVFSLVFFSVAGGLYGNNLSRTDEGLIVAADGVDEAWFTGRQQIFFPSAGTVDLGLTGVETMSEDSAGPRMGRFSSPVLSGLRDDGEIVAPALSVGNLSYRSFRLSQRLALGPIDASITIQPTQPQRTAELRITNNTGFPLEQVSIWQNGECLNLPRTIEPGETFTHTGTFTRGGPIPVPPTGAQTVLTARVAAPVGAQIGTRVETATSPLLLYVFSPEVAP